MRRITLTVMGTLSALVVLFSYHTSTNSGATAAGTPSSGGSGGTGGGTPSSSGGSASSADGASSGEGSTYTGDEVDTRWGVVQVQVTVADGRITAAEAVQYPSENHRDQEINSYAVPELNSEAVDRQSGDIDVVSGATVTSDGYIESLQSAIDKANL
jgi:uncharacterized protein with FMN-binding domain